MSLVASLLPLSDRDKLQQTEGTLPASRFLLISFSCIFAPADQHSRVQGAATACEGLHPCPNIDGEGVSGGSRKMTTLVPDLVKHRCCLSNQCSNTQEDANLCCADSHHFRREWHRHQEARTTSEKGRREQDSDRWGGSVRSECADSVLICGSVLLPIALFLTVHVTCLSQDIEDFLEREVFLELSVQCAEKW